MPELTIEQLRAKCVEMGLDPTDPDDMMCAEMCSWDDADDELLPS